MKTPPDPPPSTKRHSRKCVICAHPDREAIDEAFLHWCRNDLILKEFSIPNLSSLYRHAHACGLWNLRRNKLRCALDRLIEHAGDCKPSGGAVVRAVEVSCRFDQDDRYVEPVKRVIIEHRSVVFESDSNRECTAPSPDVTPTKQTKADKNSNLESLRLETCVTSTKQRPDPKSNLETTPLFTATASDESRTS